MKILLCTPYLDTPGVVPGGISVWARNILGYYRTLCRDGSCSVFEVTPVSYDRRYIVSGKSTVLIRFFYGVRDYFSSIRETRSRLKSRQYSVLHLCTSAQLSLYKDLLIMKMARHYGAKAIVHLHFGRTPGLCMKNNWEWRILMRVCKAADRVAVMDGRSYDTLLKHGFSNIHYLPNPLSMEIIRQVNRDQPSVARTPGKILFVGSLIRAKGVFDLVQACCQLEDMVRQTHHKFELHIVGAYNDEGRNALLAIAHGRTNSDWLRLRGRLSHEEVLREMMSASLFAFPSWTEGFPNVILEAMACGCPIVSTTVGAIPEMLNTAHADPCGICVHPRQVQPLADALKYMLTDQEYAARCARNARQRANEMYAVPKVWEQLCDIWNDSLVNQ